MPEVKHTPETEWAALRILDPPKEYRSSPNNKRTLVSFLKFRALEGSYPRPEQFTGSLLANDLSIIFGEEYSGERYIALLTFIKTGRNPSARSKAKSKRPVRRNRRAAARNA